MERKLISGLAKVFPDEIYNGAEIDSINCLKDEKTSFQIVFRSDTDKSISVTTDCKELHIYKIVFVPAGKTGNDERDDYFIRNAVPGDYPDVLVPLGDEKIELKKGEWTAVWCEFTPDNQFEAGTHTLSVVADGEKIEVKAEIFDAQLGDQTLICTNWFHTDCLAHYYNVEVFSEDWWRIVENFMRTAVEHGINLILTPIFTPPLDTKVGGERLTVQLVDVKKVGYTYTFGFDKLKRWVDTAHKCGIQYFEMAHLFTQWGAKHAPKIMAETSKGYKRIFGWETNAHGQGYENFLRQFAAELIKFINENGIHDYCMFHISDEPSKKDYFSYKKCAKLISELFGEFTCFDALSDYSFYKHGLTKLPVTNIEEIEDFAGNVPDLWTYYCCNPDWDCLPNRFMAMPSVRNRIIGFLMYQYNATGFLHWGYNFYNTRYSLRSVDPYKETDADGEFSSGDSFVVYPAPDGTAYCSLRLKVFYDAIQDYEALRRLEKKIGREKTLALLNEGLENPLKSKDYPHDEAWILAKRRQINELLAK